jgi:hypothetical protein
LGFSLAQNRKNTINFFFLIIRRIGWPNLNLSATQHYKDAPATKLFCPGTLHQDEKNRTMLPVFFPASASETATNGKVDTSRCCEKNMMASAHTPAYIMSMIFHLSRTLTREFFHDGCIEQCMDQHPVCNIGMKQKLIRH